MGVALKKVDLKRDLKLFYSAPAKGPVAVDVPAMQFLMIDGEGDPNTSAAFADAVGALYGVAYKLKFTVKKSPQPVDYPVMPLEALWWADDPAAFVEANKAAWKWTVMVMQPDLVTSELFAEAVRGVRLNKPSEALDRMRLERFFEGKAAQMLHIGPYGAEAANIRRLHAFIAAQGGVLTGKHHEIYLNDARRTAREKLRTIIRQPFDME